eukprot:3004655-Alexandrium_andersonii.AAC.1
MSRRRSGPSSGPSTSLAPRSPSVVVRRLDMNTAGNGNTRRNSYAIMGSVVGLFSDFSLRWGPPI